MPHSRSRTSQMIDGRADAFLVVNAAFVVVNAGFVGTNAAFMDASAAFVPCERKAWRQRVRFQRAGSDRGSPGASKGKARVMAGFSHTTPIVFRFAHGQEQCKKNRRGRRYEGHGGSGNWEITQHRPDRLRVFGGWVNFLPNSQDATRHSGDGSRPQRSRLVSGRTRRTALTRS